VKRSGFTTPIAMQPANSTNHVRYCLAIAFSVLVVTLLLFSIDKDTHSFSDLFKPENIGALIIYFTPAFIICAGLYFLLARRRNAKSSFIIALAAGIPVSFTLIILSLMFYMGRL
jgi:hypothetical protein